MFLMLQHLHVLARSVSLAELGSDGPEYLRLPHQIHLRGVQVQSEMSQSSNAQKIISLKEIQQSARHNLLVDPVPPYAIREAIQHYRQLPEQWASGALLAETKQTYVQKQKQHVPKATQQEQQQMAMHIVKESKICAQQSMSYEHPRVMKRPMKMLRLEHSDALLVNKHVGLPPEGQGKSKRPDGIYRRALRGSKHMAKREQLASIAKILEEALLLMDNGRYREAELKYRQALEISKKLYGPNHDFTLMSLEGIVVSLTMQHKYIDAEKIGWQALELHKNVRGPEDQRTLRSMDKLALTLHVDDKYKEAETLYRQSLEIRLRTLGPAHQDTHTNINKLGLVLTDQGRHKEAGELRRTHSLLHLQGKGGEFRQRKKQQSSEVTIPIKNRPVKKSKNGWFPGAKKYLTSSEGKKQLAAFGIGALATGIGLQAYNGLNVGKQHTQFANQLQPAQPIQWKQSKKTELVPGPPSVPSKSLTVPYLEPAPVPYQKLATVPYFGSETVPYTHSNTVPYAIPQTVPYVNQGTDKKVEGPNGPGTEQNPPGRKLRGGKSKTLGA